MKKKKSKSGRALKRKNAAARKANANKSNVKADKTAVKAGKAAVREKIPTGDLLKIIGVFAAAALMLVVGLAAFRAADRHSILTQRNEISSAGIDAYADADVNGIKQYVHIRGQNKNLPLLLIFPDYPGYLCASSDYMLGNELESYFTVVTWDMRGTGQTEVLNAENGIDSGSEFTYSVIADDAKGICEYVRTRLGRENDRFIVLGYSWGSAAAADFARRYPEYISAYFGVSQISDFKLGITTGLMDAAQTYFNSGDVEEFNRYVDTVKLINDEENAVSAENIRKAAGMLKGSRLAPSLYDIEVSPFCSTKADSAFESAPKRTNAYLESICGFDSANFINCFALANFHLIYGENDYFTPIETAGTFIGSNSRLSCIEGAGHELLFENPTETADIIRKKVFGTED